MTLAPQGPFIHVFGWPLLLQSFLVLTFIHYHLVMRHRGFVTVGLAQRYRNSWKETDNAGELGWGVTQPSLPGQLSLFRSVNQPTT